MPAATDTHPEIERYIDALWIEKGLSDHTLDAYRRDLRQFDAFLGREVGSSLLTATREQLQRYLGARLAAGQSPRSTARVMSCLRGFYRYQLREGRLTVDPTLDVDSPRLGRPLPKSLSEAEVEKLLSAAMLSPTAFNIQNWRFVRVKDPELRQQVRAAAWDQAQVTDASLLLVLCADLGAWKKDPARYWKDAPEPVREFILPALAQYYEGREQVQRDEAMRSCGIAAQTLMVAAKAMGYDSCPMDGFDFDAVAKLIQLPKDHVISMFVVVGKATQPAWDRPGQLPMDEVVIQDRFGG